MLRWIRHLLCDWWSVNRAFSKDSLAAIEACITEEERRHDGEIRFAVEAALPIADLIRGVTSRNRALEIFSRLHVWDTEHNSGVLIYVLLADRRVEVVADRGINRRVPPQTWQSICGVMEREFATRRMQVGATAGIRAVSDILAKHLPVRGKNPHELPNKPVIL